MRVRLRMRVTVMVRVRMKVRMRVRVKVRVLAPHSTFGCGVQQRLHRPLSDVGFEPAP